MTAARDVVGDFRTRCDAHVRLWLDHKLDLHAAVDGLQGHAVASGLVAAIGQDAVQWIMSEAFRPYRRPGDRGEPPP
jgi:hypothetical protein